MGLRRSWSGLLVRLAGAAQRLARAAEDDEAAVPAATLARDVRKADEPAPVEAQAAFDRLKSPPERPLAKKQSAPGSIGRVEDLDLVSRYFEQQANVPRQALEERAREAAPAKSKRAARKERSALPEAESAAGRGEGARILTFESELDPFEFSLLDSRPH